MKYGINLTGYGVMADPDKLRRVTRRADELGFHSVWLYEHTAFPIQLTRSYPKVPFTPEDAFLEPFTALSFLAADTKQIHLGTGILLLGLRHPLHVAKTVSTLDVFSGGRVILGVGLGWLAEEFEAFGIPFSERAGRVRESVEILRKVWTTGRVQHEGRYFTFPEVSSLPMPVQKGGPPIWFGATADAALVRAIELGDGWLGGAIRFDRLGEWLPKIRKLAAEKGKPNFAIATSVSSDITREQAEQVEKLGATQLNLMFNSGEAADILGRVEAAAVRLGVKP